MKRTVFLLFLLLIAASGAVAQLRQAAIHQRGMLHQTEYNTGEIGRAFDRGDAGILDGYPSMEWPPNSMLFLDRRKYAGQHNSFGAGLYIAGTRSAVRTYSFCGAVTTNNGGAQAIEGVYSTPLSLQRLENYPLRADGSLNPAYNPDEAEEIITAKWGTITGVTVTRTSRAWSFPDYDDFIIYEYELENTGADTLYDVFVGWGYGLCPSMFGYERVFNRWAEGDLRTKDQFARFDFRRWMSYNHDRSGKPDSAYYDEWGRTGRYGGGLNSPQAAGFMLLHYDYNHLALRRQTTLNVRSTDAGVVWDANGRVKQPFLNRYENANLYVSKLQPWLDPAADRKTGPFRGATDSLNYSANNYYWIGRAKPSWDLGWSQPGAHVFALAPYTLAPHAVARFAIAEVVGYGPGLASDSVYSDLGGSGMRGDAEPGQHKIPSWSNLIAYPAAGNPPFLGSTYLQKYPLPWYVNSGVISIRDVADKAIEMYTGWRPVKYDTAQFDPTVTPDHGVYRSPIPVPAPVIRVENTGAAVNRIVWTTQAERFATPRLTSHLRYYKALRATHPLGPWTVIDSVGIRDPRYFKDSTYVLYDKESNLQDLLYYAVVSVDSLGRVSGMTNFTAHTTQAPAAS
ncbi:MAG TPA: T9SS C-terminal target domain-containing protein, partial [Bacteroidota bacterium]